MRYVDVERYFGLLVQLQRYQGQQLLGQELSPIERERCQALQDELDRRFQDGEG